MTVEDTTNNGRIDALLELPSTLVLFEFKLHGSAEQALKQIEHKQYYQKYLNCGKKLFLLGYNSTQPTETSKNGS